MNAPASPGNLVAQPLYMAALSALVPPSAEAPHGAEAQWLHGLRVHSGDAPTAMLEQWLAGPPLTDARLHALTLELGMSLAEVIAIVIAAAVETDAMVGRVMSWLQAPVGGSRPSLGLILAVTEGLGVTQALSQILNGPARASGLLQLENELRPLPEVSVQVPVPLVLALHGGISRWPGVRLGLVEHVELVGTMRVAAAANAAALSAGLNVLAVRSGHPREARAAAACVANELGMRAAFIESEVPRGLGPWLSLVGAMPVFCAELAPGETRRLPELPGYRGPVLVATGPDGSFERDGDAVSNWRVPLPTVSERVDIWQEQTGDGELAERMGRSHRYGLAKIQLLSNAASHQASADQSDRILQKHIASAARTGVAGELGTLAELQCDDIADGSLVIPDALRETLNALLQRCAAREGLADALGPAARTRYRPGVRALFVGPSGTGKTLAAGWLATRLGLPLYRVDVASVTSKYIGETEKNLAQLFARAEHTEVVLLFDEADALFSKRTDVKESNDRFANSQTNYLLQRIESFEGIAILTSNSRARFDTAFTRRLDAIVDFPLPAPDERRALWLAHLGDGHVLSPTDINRFAACCDLAGGHIRNVVLHAAALTHGHGRAITYDDILAGVAAECKKLGKQTPHGLAQKESS